MFRHAAIGDQPPDRIDLLLAPDALATTRAVASQEALLVQTLADAVNPALAQHRLDGLFRIDGFESGAALVDFNPDLGRLVLFLREPALKFLSIREATDMRGIDVKRGHAGTAYFVTISKSMASAMA